MGLFSSIGKSLFGSSGSGNVSMPAQDPRISGAMNELYNRQQQQASLSSQLGSQIPGLINQMGQAPTLGTAEQTELDYASQTYTNMLNKAKLNIFNQVGTQMAGGLGNISQLGASLGGATAQGLSAGIASRGQASLNEYAANQSQSLLNYRSQILNNVYQRLLNKSNAIFSQQAQQDSLAASNLGSFIKQDTSERTNAFNVSAYNSQQQQAQSAAGGSFVSGLLGMGLQAASPFISGFASSIFKGDNK